LDKTGKKISVYYVDPGTVNTEITKSMPRILRILYYSAGRYIFKTPFQGACCSIYASLAPELEGKTGLFLFEGKIKEKIARSTKEYDEEREKLWHLSETLASTKFPFNLAEKPVIKTFYKK